MSFSDIYLQAGIFFSTNELDHGSRDSTVALRQLQWFQSEVIKRKLLELCKLPASRQALDRFVSINVTLLRNLKFQEINQTAIAKIIKSKSASRGEFSLNVFRVRQENPARGNENVPETDTVRSNNVRNNGKGHLLAGYT
jgi:hypothetical protein